MKGAIYTIEALFAVAIVSIALVTAFDRQPSQPDFGLGSLEQTGWDALDNLYVKGDLRLLVARNLSNDVNATADLKKALRNNIPESMDFVFDICDNIKKCSATILADEVVSIDYYIEEKKLKLWIFRRQI